MSNGPIKFLSNPSSNEDDLPAHQSFEEDVSFDVWRPSDYTPPWSSKKEEPEEEDKDEDDADVMLKTTRMTPTPTPTLTLTRLLPSERGEQRGSYLN